MSRSPVLVFALTLAACGEPAEELPDAARADAAGADAAVDAVAGDAGADGGVVDVACTPGTGLTLGIAGSDPGAALPAARLAVMFWQPNDDLTPAPALAVGLDVALAPLGAGETRCVELDLAALQAPAADGLQLCDRTCQDLGNPSCACQAGQPRVAVAFVVVGQDRDGNGRLDPAELTAQNIHGAGWLGIGVSPAARAAGSQPESIVDLLFPGGLEAGARAYQVQDTTSFDRLVPAAAGTVFQVRVCPPGSTTCRARFPNVT